MAGRRGAIVLAILAVGGGASCSGPPRPPVQGGEEIVVPMRSIDEVLANYSDSLMTLPGVVGTAIALCERGERCIKVLLDDASPETLSRIPNRIEGYRVVTEVSGTIRPR